jgi:hypothetical protein
MEVTVVSLWVSVNNCYGMVAGQNAYPSGIQAVMRDGAQRSALGGRTA